MKKILAPLFLLTLLLILASCGGGQDTDDDSTQNNAQNGGQSTSSDNVSVPEEREYTFWIRGEKFYTGYDANPGLEYLETLSWGEDENGNKKYLDIIPYIPVTGAEADNFNTLIGTGEYMDVMDLSTYIANSGRVIDLYEEGIAMDITEYVESYMPNYRAFLDANPGLKAIATDMVDGEKRYLRLFIYADDIPDMWGGFLYRRDWLVKYGTHPENGSSFSGEFTIMQEDGSPDPDSWEDNVVFPSGGSDPVYISDWEWMFGIFDKALEEQGITDGYAMSLYHPGYIELGDLITSFGGGGAKWYITPENEVRFGGTSDTFRVYLQALHTWYANGWIDKAFTEHSSDLFYTVDPARLYSGKVGLWWGSMSSLGARLSTPDSPYLDGFVAFTAAQPINDIYGSADEQNTTPYTMYQTTQEGPSFMVTTKVEEKDIETLFTFLDYMYSEEGAVLRTFGLSKEQYDITQNEFMTNNGYTEGAYTVVEEEGETRYLMDAEIQAAGHQSAVVAGRLPGLQAVSLGSTAAHAPDYYTNVDRLVQYPDTGNLPATFQNSLSDEDFNTYNKTNTNINEFMSRYVSPFIKGEKDPFDDDDWNAYVTALNKYEPDKVIELFQPIADDLYK